MAGVVDGMKIVDDVLIDEVVIVRGCFCWFLVRMRDEIGRMMPLYRILVMRVMSIQQAEIGESRVNRCFGKLGDKLHAHAVIVSELICLEMNWVARMLFQRKA